jgi:hypothetical protein
MDKTESISYIKNDDNNSKKHTTNGIKNNTFSNFVLQNNLICINTEVGILKSSVDYKKKKYLNMIIIILQLTKSNTLTLLKK